MHENILHEHRFTFTVNDIPDLELRLYDNFNGLFEVYSYIVYIVSNEQMSTHFVLRYMVADTVEYNTLTVSDLIIRITDICTDYMDYTGKTKVLCYSQPPLDMFIMLYEPMMDKMVKRLNCQWSYLEYDDLMQICRMCCVELYNKGYYIHKNLLWTTFKNTVLEEIRPLKKRAIVVSIWDKHYDGGVDDKDLSIADSIIDIDALYEEQDTLCKQGELQIFNEIKDIIIDLVGQRQFDALYRDYKNKHTTTTTRKLLTKIKNHLASMGITRDDFNKKYH